METPVERKGADEPGAPHDAAATAERSAAAGAPFAGIVSFCHGLKFAEMGKWALLSHKTYAARHGYDHFVGNEDVLPHMHFLEPFAWLKAGLFWQLLQKRSGHQWFVWVDCDALYMNYDKALPDLLRDVGVDPTPQGQTHIVLAQDIGGSLFNTGVLLVRNSEWSRDYFARVLRMARNPEVRHHGWWEQMAMQNLYKQNQHGEGQHMHVVGERFRLNAFTVENEYRDGESFVLHQVNCPGHGANMAASVDDCGRNLARYLCAKLASEYPGECARVPPVGQLPAALPGPRGSSAVPTWNYAG